MGTETLPEDEQNEEPQGETSQNEELDIRDQVAAAFEEMEGDTTDGDEGEGTTDSSDKGAQEEGQPEKSETEAKDGDTKPNTPEDSSQKPAKIDKAPVGWKPDTREKWGDLPENVKTQIAEREREVAVIMQDTADARKVSGAFMKTITPFKQAIDQMGYADPFTAVRDIMGAAAGMSQGSPTDRAVAAAKVLKSFGISVSELDNALVNVGHTASQSQDSTSQLEALLDKRLAPVQQLLSQQNTAQQSQQHHQQTQASTEVSTFMAQAEFANDVRNDMADLLDLAAKQNRNMSLQEAYDKACLINPSIQQVVQQRQQQDLQTKAAEQNKRKRHAASSVTGNPAGNGSVASVESVEDALNEAWDFHIRG